MGTAMKRKGKKGSGEEPAKHIAFRDANPPRPVNNGYLPPSGRALRSSPSSSTLNRLERQRIVLWRRPLTTLYYFLCELACLLREAAISLWHRKLTVLSVVLFSVIFAYGYHHPRTQTLVASWEKRVLWWLYWVGLGVLSSVGFGTGLHTFLIYLGPHIASVTMAAYECDSVKFPEPPYPDKIICPDAGNRTLGLVTSAVQGTAITLWTIISKVRWESLMWGAGTALGELPPYFMARAARLSGQEPDDEEYREFLAFVEGDRPKTLGLLDRGRLCMERIVERLGFLGILIFASVPNPFFDLAGITCGHFLVPFWTFFGATLIGKAAIKMHIQMLFVVIAFSEHHVERVVSKLGDVPHVGPLLQSPIRNFLHKQKTKFHRAPGVHVNQEASGLQTLLSAVVAGMIAWFLLSIINSLAQRYHKRIFDEKKQYKK